MGLLVRRATYVASLVILTGCAASGPAPRALAPPQSAPAPARSASPPAGETPPANPGTTGLTGATVSSVGSDEPEPGWTDAKIVAVLVAANQGDVEEANLAARLSHVPRVLRFAEHMQRDDGVLGDRARGLAQRLGSKDSPSRLEVDVERAGFLVAMREAPPEKVDRLFARAQAEQCESLLRLIDMELVPAAKDPELVSLLREMRAGAMHHLGIAEELQSSLPQKAAAHSTH